MVWTAIRQPAPYPYSLGREGIETLPLPYLPLLLPSTLSTLDCCTQFITYFRTTPPHPITGYHSPISICSSPTPRFARLFFFFSFLPTVPVRRLHTSPLKPSTTCHVKAPGRTEHWISRIRRRERRSRVYTRVRNPERSKQSTYMNLAPESNRSIGKKERKKGKKNPPKNRGGRDAPPEKMNQKAALPTR